MTSRATNGSDINRLRSGWVGAGAACGSQDEIVRLLDSDSRLTPAVLKKLAEELNIAVPSTVKSKGATQLHIAQSAASHWHRTRGGL